MSASKAVQISGPQNKASKIKSILLKKKRKKKQKARKKKRFKWKIFKHLVATIGEKAAFT